MTTSSHKQLKLGNRLVIYPINNTLIDVFHGTKDWDSGWTRFYVKTIQGTKVLSIIKGDKISRSDFNEVTNYVLGS